MMLLEEYSPVICVAIVVFLLLILWIFFGGQSKEPVGLAPLDNIHQYEGPFYNPIEAEIVTDVTIDYTPSVPNHYRSVESLVSNEITEQSPIIVKPEIGQQFHNSGAQQSHSLSTQQSNSFGAQGENEGQKSVTVSKISEVSKVVFSEKMAERTRSRMVSRGERICCETMKKIYGVQFVTVRPKWLRNPETGMNLELDCYNEDLRLAVEYNGVQHYEWPNFTNCTYDQFCNQVRRDRFKREQCEKQGVYLITVPHTVAYEKIPEYIMSLLPETLQQRLQEAGTLHSINTTSI